MGKKKAQQYSKNDLQSSVKKVGDILSTYTLNWAALPLTRIAAAIGISPNQVTFISAILGLLAGASLVVDSFIFRLGSILLLYISMIIDSVDGKLARLTGVSNVFGAVFDEWCDRLVDYALFLGITLGLYLRSSDPLVLILGFLAVANFLFMHFSRALVNAKSKDTVREFTLIFRGQHFYIGFSTVTYYILMAMALTDTLYFFLLAYAVLGPALWLKKIITAYKNLPRHKV